MNAQIDATEANQSYKNQSKHDRQKTPTPIVHARKDDRSQRAVKHGRHHSVSAGKAVARRSQQWIIKVRTRALENALQPEVQDHAAVNGQQNSKNPMAKLLAPQID